MFRKCYEIFIFCFHALVIFTRIPGIVFQSSKHVDLMSGWSKSSLENVLFSMYPKKKTLTQLNEFVDDSVFVVNAVVS
jgi:hypothetical protein